MNKRRPLTEGIKPSKDKELEFVFGSKANQPKEKPVKKKPVRKLTKPEEPEAPKPKQEIVAAEPPAPAAVRTPLAGREPSRVPFTTRIRGDIASALKEASLKRQLSNQTPFTVQEILEEALEPWLKKHGYLP
jgi:hypothetical protein